MKKVSIIVPIYNSELYLDECIKSIINQTYKNIEILLLDDGSTDNSLTICNKYKKEDSRIRIIKKNNSGVSNTRNIGITKSLGEYIAFVDSDDVIDKRYIEYLIKDIDDTYFNVCKSKIIYSNNLQNLKNTKYKKNELEKKDFIYLSEINVLNSPCYKLFNRKIIKENRIKFNENLSLGEDLLFNLDYLKHIKKIYIVDNELYCYRKSNTKSLTKKYRPNMEEIQLLLLNKFEEFFYKIKGKYEKTYNTQIVNFISAIIVNEYRNNNINFYKKIRKINTFLKRQQIKQILKKHKKTNNNIKYIVLRYHFIILYYLYQKIINYIHK